MASRGRISLNLNNLSLPLFILDDPYLIRRGRRQAQIVSGLPPPKGISDWRADEVATGGPEHGGTVERPPVGRHVMPLLRGRLMRMLLLLLLFLPRH